jgi:hypothetical protein
VQFAIGVEELEDDHPLVEAMKRLAEEGDDKTEETMSRKLSMPAFSQPERVPSEFGIHAKTSSTPPGYIHRAVR